MAIKDGKRVSITDGDFKGCSGVVVGHHNHEPITYAILLDTPVVKMVQSTIDMGGGKKSVTEEEITFTRIEVAEASVSAA